MIYFNFQKSANCSALLHQRFYKSEKTKDTLQIYETLTSALQDKALFDNSAKSVARFRLCSMTTIRFLKHRKECLLHCSAIEAKLLRTFV